MSFYNIGEWTGTMYGSPRFANEYDISLNAESVARENEFGSPDLYWDAAAQDHNAYLSLTMVVGNYPNFTTERIVSTRYLDYSTAFGELPPTHWYVTYHLPQIPEIAHPQYEFKVIVSGDTWKIAPRNHLTGAFSAKLILDARHLDNIQSQSETPDNSETPEE